MKYIFDSSSLIVLFNNFYESRFPTLWDSFNELVISQKIISVREVANEISNYYNKNDRLIIWVKDNSNTFQIPNITELEYVNEIFQNSHFQSSISKKNILQGKATADPFIIAKAKALNGYVVTQEEYKENAAKIPNICKFLNVACMNLEGFMEKENWQF